MRQPNCISEPQVFRFLLNVYFVGWLCRGEIIQLAAPLTFKLVRVNSVWILRDYISGSESIRFCRPRTIATAFDVAQETRKTYNQHSWEPATARCMKLKRWSLATPVHPNVSVTITVKQEIRSSAASICDVTPFGLLLSHVKYIYPATTIVR